MPKRMAEKRGFELSKLVKPGLHAIGGVPGLYLNVANKNARSWILRLTVAGKRREMGLGPYPEITHVQAKEKAKAAREAVRQGIDPIDQARKARSLLAADRAGQLAFDDCAAAYIQAHAAGWRNVKHGDQWKNTLATYASPVIGKLLVRDVETAHVVKILSPIWATKTETASRVRGRIERVLGWATTSGYRSGENPARWHGHLENLLPKQSQVTTVEHHAAHPWRTVGAFMAVLRQQASTGAKALEFVILTAARSGEVRGATWSEVDLHEALWTIPATRMKAKAEHQVPLSKPALALLRALPRMAGTDLVFPSGKLAPLSDMTLSAVLRRMKIDATPHGFRSTFRDWCSESTNYPREVAEKSLAHAIPSAIEAAYRRGTLLEKRRRLMAEWATYCGRIPVAAPVTSINAAVAP
jgi:integrase